MCEDAVRNQFGGWLTIPALLLLTLGAYGCSQAPRPEAAGLGREPVSLEDSYRLTPGDRLKVVTFGEEDLSGEFEVGATGNIAMPLLGDVPARGQTIAQLRDGLRQRLAKGYLNNPKISVEVVNYRPFFVHGEVKNGGAFPYKAGMTIDDAIASAGGFTYRADTSVAYLRRSGVASEQAVALGSGAAILPGDNFRVPERFF
jgi:polysaccharide export outer membrane protein